MPPKATALPFDTFIMLQRLREFMRRVRAHRRISGLVAIQTIWTTAMVALGTVIDAPSMEHYLAHMVFAGILTSTAAADAARCGHGRPAHHLTLS